MNGKAHEHQADAAAIIAAAPGTLVVLGTGLTTWLPAAGLVLALALLIVGRFPEQEQALYVTAVGLGLSMGAIGLFALGFSQGRVPSTRDQS